MIPDGHRGGSTYNADLDYVRLNRQASDVWSVMWRGDWWTLRRLSKVTGHPEASISARIRDFRKERFGSHVVLRMRMSDGLFMYRLVPNPDAKIAA